MQAGMDGYIAKPLDLRVMRSEIRRTLRKRAAGEFPIRRRLASEGTTEGSNAPLALVN